MATKTYRLKLVGDGREFEAEGDKAFVLEMVRRFGNAPQSAGSSAPAKSSAKGSSTPPTLAEQPRGKNVSIREFIQLLGLKKHTDITLAFGYYLEKHRGVSDFTPADVTNCYYEAKLESSNTSQMFIQNIKSGRMMESKRTKEKGKSRYTLTQSGEAFITSKLARSS